MIGPPMPVTPVVGLDLEEDGAVGIDWSSCRRRRMPAPAALGLVLGVDIDRADQPLLPELAFGRHVAGDLAELQLGDFHGGSLPPLRYNSLRQLITGGLLIWTGRIIADDGDGCGRSTGLLTTSSPCRMTASGMRLSMGCCTSMRTPWTAHALAVSQLLGVLRPLVCDLRGNCTPGR